MDKDNKETKDIQANSPAADVTAEAKASKGKGGTEEMPSFKDVIAAQATEDDIRLTKNLTLGKILGGDILNTSTIRNQIWLFLLIVCFVIVYIANGFAVQKDLLKIDKLQQELQDAKYKALSSGSELTEKSRQSNVLDILNTNQDSVLKIASQPPFIINVPEK